MDREKLSERAAMFGLFACLALVLAFLASFVLGLRRERAAESEDVRPVQIEEVTRREGRVEVLNASGRAGLARAATDRLRSGGFDVVYFGNAPSSAGDSSVVLDRIGRDATARAAAQHLGITRVQTRVDTTLYLDATVIIGKDWTPASEPEEGGEEGWGARLKRWLSPG